MGLRDEAVAATKHPGTQGTTIFRLIALLEGDERAEVIELIWERDPNISARAIGDVLTKHFGDRVGKISGGMVEDHRRKPRPE
jgi:hypothetical protein